MIQVQVSKPMTVLDAVRHQRILEDIEHVLQVANIPKMFLAQSMTEHCDEEEIEWVRTFRTHRDLSAGLVLAARPKSDSRCFAICGALLRNFIDARVIPMNSVLSHLKNDTMPDPTVLIIPNLHVASIGKTIPSWEIQKVYDLLLARFSASKPTVVVTSELKHLRADYGAALEELLQDHYKVVT